LVSCSVAKTISHRLRRIPATLADLKPGERMHVVPGPNGTTARIIAAL
jgi:hypothetical protein